MGVGWLRYSRRGRSNRDVDGTEHERRVEPQIANRGDRTARGVSTERSGQAGEVKDSNNHTQNLTQINQLSNTVLMFALAVFVLSIAMAAYAIGVANQAEREAQNAEREARVAMNHADLLDVNTKQNAAVIEKLIVKQAVKEAIQEK